MASEKSGEKANPSPPKPVCWRCYCRFCLCGVKPGPFFEIDREARLEWYGK